jgi:hypothetical protein
MHGAGAGVREIQGVQGQLTLNQDLSGWGIHHHEKGIAFPSKLLPLARADMHPLNLCVLRIKRVLCAG